MLPTLVGVEQENNKEERAKVAQVRYMQQITREAYSPPALFITVDSLATSQRWWLMPLACF